MLAACLAAHPAALAAQSADSIPLPEHPRPDFERAEWLNLNGRWRFALESATQLIARKKRLLEGYRIVAEAAVESLINGAHPTMSDEADNFVTTLEYRSRINHCEALKIFIF